MDHDFQERVQHDANTSFYASLLRSFKNEADRLRRDKAEQLERLGLEYDEKIRAVEHELTQTMKMAKDHGVRITMDAKLVSEQNRPSCKTVRDQSRVDDSSHSLVDGPAKAPPVRSVRRQVCWSRDMTSEQKQSLVGLLRSLRNLDCSRLFREPVDFHKLNIPDYPTFFTNPMDLGTMDNKLKANRYATVNDLVNDFHLIMANTKLYNGEAHAVTLSGIKMEAYSDEMMEHVPKLNGPPENISAARQKRKIPYIVLDDDDVI